MIGATELTIIFFFVIFSIIPCFICRFLAKRKNRNVGVWTALGFFTSYLGLLILVVLPKLKD